MIGAHGINREKYKARCLVGSGAIDGHGISIATEPRGSCVAPGAIFIDPVTGNIWHTGMNEPISIVAVTTPKIWTISISISIEHSMQTTDYVPGKNRAREYSARNDIASIEKRRRSWHSKQR